MSTKLYALGLIPFLYVSFIKLFMKKMIHSIIAISVVINGILCHGSYHICDKWYCFCWFWDVILNIVFITYINVTTNTQPGVFILTLIAITSYILNIFFHHWLLHVVGVQLVLCLTLYIS